MVNKFLVFVVFAIVTQSSVLLSSATFNEFPLEAYDVFDRLESENLAARAKTFSGFSSFANLLKNGTGRTSSHQDLSPFADALSTAAEATDIIYYSALLVSRGDCGFDAALNKTRAELRKAIEIVINSIALAHGGKYDENQSEIDKKQDLKEAGLVSAYDTLFEFLRCCISDSSKEFEDLIAKVQAKVNENLHSRSNAVHEAIEAYSILTSECTEDEAAAALLTIDKILFIMIATTIDNIEHIYALYETSYIVNYLNADDIAYGVFEIRLARQRTSDKLEEAMKVVFVAIAGRLLGHTSYHETEDTNSTIADPTADIAISLLESAYEYFLQTVLLLLPNTADDVKATEIILPHILATLIRLYYDGMDLAEADIPGDLALSVIKSVEQTQSQETSVVNDKSFEIIGSDAHTAFRFVDLRYRVGVRLQNGNDAVFEAIEVLSEAAHATDGASQDDFAAIQAYLSLAIEAVSGAAKVQWYAVLYRYIGVMGY